MGTLQDLRIAARRWSETRKLPSAVAAGAAEREELKGWFEGWRRTASTSLVRDARVFDIDASQVPWLDTGMDVKRGDWVTTLAAGRVVLSDKLDIWVGPQFQLWMRVGEDSDIFNGTRSSHSFRAARDGRVYLASYFPGQWGDRTGRISTSLNEYGKFQGGITACVIRWRGDAAACLEGSARASKDSARLVDELERLLENVPPPPDWNYLWLLGSSEIFRASTDGGRLCIACHTERNVGILQHEAVFDLKAGTRLRWSWKVDELPSVLPENTPLSHDYLSVAVEFENGRDITYTWSPSLPAGTGYWCPLPTWKDREFHVVVRSGTQDLGKWLDEERDLEADYRHFMGEPPKRVVRIWLIAVSLFQRRTGRAMFRDFLLESPSDGRKLAID